jgi:hypothetical protein
MKKLFFVVFALFAITAVNALNITSATNVTSGRELFVQVTNATANQTCTVYTSIGNYVLDYAQYDDKLKFFDESLVGLKVNAGGNAYYNFKVDDRYPIGQEFNLTADCGTTNVTKAILVKRSNSDVETSNMFYNLTSEWTIIKLFILILVIIFLLLTGRLLYGIYNGVK